MSDNRHPEGGVVSHVTFCTNESNPIFRSYAIQIW